MRALIVGFLWGIFWLGAGVLVKDSALAWAMLVVALAGLLLCGAWSLWHRPHRVNLTASVLLSRGRSALCVTANGRVERARGRVTRVVRDWESEPRYSGVFQDDGSADWSLRWNNPDAPENRRLKSFSRGAVLHLAFGGRMNDWWLDVADMDGSQPPIAAGISHLKKDYWYWIEVELDAENASPVIYHCRIKYVENRVHDDGRGHLTILSIPPTFEIEGWAEGGLPSEISPR